MINEICSPLDDDQGRLWNFPVMRRVIGILSPAISSFTGTPSRTTCVGQSMAQRDYILTSLEALEDCSTVLWTYLLEYETAFDNGADFDVRCEIRNTFPFELDSPGSKDLPTFASMCLKASQSVTPANKFLEELAEGTKTNLRRFLFYMTKKYEGNLIVSKLPDDENYLIKVLSDCFQPESKQEEENKQQLDYETLNIRIKMSSIKYLTEEKEKEMNRYFKDMYDKNKKGNKAGALNSLKIYKMHKANRDHYLMQIENMETILNATIKAASNKKLWER